MRVVCEKCNAELEISAKDVKTKEGGCGGMMEGNTQIYHFYKCPCCDNKNYLELPELIRAFGIGVKL